MAISDGPGRPSAPVLPHEFPRRILVAVIGLTPQVLTETLYALAVRPACSASPFVPTAIRIVTTARGRDRTRRELLHPHTGRFFQLCTDYRIDPRTIAFDDSSFLVLERDGHPLEDVTGAADHAVVAKTIRQLVRHLTADDGAAIHASLAGGRRTMGFYLGHALSLYGRPQDRLSHVLVDPRLAAADAFYYPPATPATVVVRSRSVNTGDAGITLVDVPFLRLRDGLPLRTIDELPPFSETGTDMPRATAPLAIELHYRGCLLIVGAHTVRLPPADFAFYALMARRRAAGRDFINYRTPGLDQKYLREYTTVTVDHWAPNVVRVRRRLRNGADQEWFEQRKARVNHAIRSALGPWLGRAYQIASEGRRPETRFGLLVEPALIILQD